MFFGAGGLWFWTYCCNARRSSRSLPTSWRRIRTSLARALLKSFRYLYDGEGREINFPKFASDLLSKGSTYLGVAVGEKGAPGGLLEAICAVKEERVIGDGWKVVVVEVMPRCELQAASGQDDVA